MCRFGSWEGKKPNMEFETMTIMYNIDQAAKSHDWDMKEHKDRKFYLIYGQV